MVGRHLASEGVTDLGWYCAECEQPTNALYVAAAGAWTCPNCGLTLSPAFEGDGLLRCRAPFVDSDDEQEQVMRDIRAASQHFKRKRAEDGDDATTPLERVAARHKLTDAPSDVGGMAEHLAHSHGYSAAIGAACRDLALRWHAHVAHVGRFELVASAALCRVLFERRLVRMRAELLEGAVGPFSKSIETLVRRMSDELHLQPPYTLAHRVLAFVDRFVDVLPCDDDHVERARGLANRLAGVVHRAQRTRTLPEELALSALMLGAPNGGGRGGHRWQRLELRDKERLRMGEWQQRCASLLRLTPAQLVQKVRRARHLLLQQSREQAAAASAPAAIPPPPPALLARPAPLSPPLPPLELSATPPPASAAPPTPAALATAAGPCGPRSPPGATP